MELQDLRSGVGWDKFLQAWETAHLKGSKEADGGGWQGGWHQVLEIQRIKTESRQNGSWLGGVSWLSAYVSIDWNYNK